MSLSMWAILLVEAPSLRVELSVALANEASVWDKYVRGVFDFARVRCKTLYP